MKANMNKHETQSEKVSALLFPYKKAAPGQSVIFRLEMLFMSSVIIIMDIMLSTFFFRLACSDAARCFIAVTSLISSVQNIATIKAADYQKRIIYPSFSRICVMITVILSLFFFSLAVLLIQELSQFSLPNPADAAVCAASLLRIFKGFCFEKKHHHSPLRPIICISVITGLFSTAIAFINTSIFNEAFEIYKPLIEDIGVAFSIK